MGCHPEYKMRYLDQACIRQVQGINVQRGYRPARRHLECLSLIACSAGGFPILRPAWQWFWVRSHEIYHQYICGTRHDRHHRPTPD